MSRSLQGYALIIFPRNAVTYIAVMVAAAKSEVLKKIGWYTSSLFERRLGLGQVLV